MKFIWYINLSIGIIQALIFLRIVAQLLWKEITKFRWIVESTMQRCIEVIGK